MIISKVIFVAIATAIIIIVLKKENSPIVPLSLTAAGIFIIFMILPDLKVIMGFWDLLSINFDNSQYNIGIILKLIVIAIVSEFASQLCVDLGQEYLASKITFATKLVMLCKILPVLSYFMNCIIGLIYDL